ncbi:OmpA family protein [Chryseosolibacter indicus]|uniref:OmpA family protein n=1 Tax=Chryseosolibacter indicus TaxID=2782351 RepID=A0ABS5VNG4_9BACT|nr:OmpA family protein [Chryseosolibacter indicus]MBT1702992.1 OmpA family protein [Chryseosolibacter indicus]
MKNVFLFLVLACYYTHAQPVIIHETFDKNVYGWYEKDSEHHKLLIRNGKYYLEAPEGGWMTYFTPYIETQKDFSIQATFTQLDGLEDNGIGFVWGYDGKQSTNSFTFTSNGNYRIWTTDPLTKLKDVWQQTKLVKPKGEDNVLKLEQKKGTLYFYLNGKLLTTTPVFPWFGKHIGFVCYTKMKLLIDDFIFTHDIKINKPVESLAALEKENMGHAINTIYDEVSPKISADGKVLYFGRKHSPQNVGGVNDKEDIWMSEATANGWTKSVNLGPPLNSPSTNNLLSVSIDNNTLLFHTSYGFALKHRTDNGWSAPEDLGINFKNESQFLEGSLSADGKAIVFVAKLKSNAYYRQDKDERDIYVCLKKENGKWTSPIHTGKIINSSGDEYSPFLSADGRTLYFASNGRPGYGDADIFMTKRISDKWNQWSEPVNLGLGINTVGFDAYYTLPASGEYGYMVTNVKGYGLADIVRFKIPQDIKPDPVVLVTGRVLNARTQLPLSARITFDDLKTLKEIGEARSDPKTGEYSIALPSGKSYGYLAAAAGYLSVNENLELVHLEEYSELKKDLLLVPIEVGESIQLKNVFFEKSKPDLLPESFLELDRLVEILKENKTMEIQLEGHTDSVGDTGANLLLSKQRVDAVERYLVKKGIDDKRITGQGYGGSRPVAPSDTEENRQLNRRVEFKITRK